MLKLILAQLKDSVWKYGLVLLLFLFIAVLIPLAYDLITTVYNNILKETPPVYNGVSIFDDFSLYLWSQWHAKNLVQIGSFIAIIFGVGAIADLDGQGQNKAVEKLFWLKVLTGIIALVMSILLASIVLILTAQLLFTTVTVGRLFLTLLITLLGLITVYLLSLFYGLLFADAVNGAMLAVFSCLILVLPTWLGVSKNLSFFNLISGERYFVYHHSPIGAILSLVVLNIALTRVVYLYFKKYGLRGFKQ